MNKYIHRILFKLGFCKKEAKTILEAALFYNKMYYMCSRVNKYLSSESHLNFKYGPPAKAHYMSAYGFTFDNYKKFIVEKYPSLAKYLNQGGYGSPWLSTYYRVEEIDRDLAAESKDEFLKYLISRL